MVEHLNNVRECSKYIKHACSTRLCAIQQSQASIRQHILTTASMDPRMTFSELTYGSTARNSARKDIGFASTDLSHNILMLETINQKDGTWLPKMLQLPLEIAVKKSK